MATLFRLEAKSRKGKNRINEHGELWSLVETINKVMFSDKPGPWHNLNSIKRPMYGRWVHDTDDDNFIIIERIEDK